MATYRDVHSCTGGGNGARGELIQRDLASRGYSQTRTDQLIDAYGKEGLQGFANLYPLVRNRGEINGEPADVLFNPVSTVYQRLETVSGKIAFGFDLDERGAGAPNSFTDPDTLQQGVDNELFQVVGCYNTYHINYPARPWLAEQADNNRYQYLLGMDGIYRGEPMLPLSQPMVHWRVSGLYPR